MAINAIDELRRRFRHAHDVVDAELLFRADAEIRKPRIALALQLFLIAENGIHLRHGRKGRPLDLRGTARHHDARIGLFALQPADGLARLAHRLAGHGAGVDENGLSKPGGLGLAAHDLAFEGVEPTAEGDDLDAQRSAASGVSTASRENAPV